jgi:uncharacterized protein (DUF1778 family)
MAVKRNKFLQVKMDDAEREVVNEVAASYGLDASTFIRKAIAQIAAAPMRLQVYPILEEGGRPMAGKPPSATTAKDGSRWLQVRVSDEERELVEELARMYNTEVSVFIRILVGYFRVVHPKLEVLPQGKVFALEAAT